MSNKPVGPGHFQVEVFPGEGETAYIVRCGHPFLATVGQKTRDSWTPKFPAGVYWRKIFLKEGETAAINCDHGVMVLPEAKGERSDGE